MSIIKTTLIASSIGLGILAPLGNIFDSGEQLGNMAASAILGVVCIACVVALIKLFALFQRKRDEHDQRLYDLIESGTEANQAVADAIKTNTTLMVEVKDQMMQCRIKGALSDG